MIELPGSAINRTVSSFDVSIATGLSLESLFDPTAKRYDVERTPPTRVDIGRYDSFGFNLLTLARNIVRSYSTADTLQLDRRLVDALLTYEVGRIRELFAPYNTKVFFYYPQYTTVHKTKNILIQIRKSNTSKQLLEHDLTHDSVKQYYKENKNEVVFCDELPTSNTRTMIFSSYLLDMVNYDRFRELSLLESTTGVVRDRSTMYQRYYNGKNIYPLPFTRGLLMVFGDHGMFRPADAKVRATIIETATKMKWTPFTTKEKVKHDTNTYIKDKFLVEMFNLL
jgi:hypothetical protein